LYVPLDVAFFDDEKILAAGERATYLYVAILLRIKMLDTDGIITRAQVARTGVPGWQIRLARLVAVGLLLTDDGDEHIVPTWSRWNELSHERSERLRADRERKARTRVSGDVSARNPDGFTADSALKQASKQADKQDSPRRGPVSLRRIVDEMGSP
jgi:hypothetical protein